MALRGVSIFGPNRVALIDLVILLLIPVIWLNYLHHSQGWANQLFLSSSKYYEKAFFASGKTLLLVAAFAYIIKEPISRSLILLIFIIGFVSSVVIRFILRHSYTAQLMAQKSAKFYVVATKAEHEELLLSVDLLGANQLELVLKELTSNDSIKEWDSVITEIQKLDYAGLIVGDAYFPTNEIFSRVSIIQSQRSFKILIYSEVAQLLPRLGNLENNNLMELSHPLLTGRFSFAKRAIDVVLSFTALVVLSPIFLLTAIAVKASSKGPILYIDQRIGRNNELFAFPKFRSMYVGADQMRHTVLGDPDDQMPHRYKADPRITPLGRFIRRWSIDELPQIFSVLIGTMSLVGPRPILRVEDIDVPLANRSRFLAKPGLTGLWQVSGRKEVLWHNRMAQDTLYIQNWSLFNDFVLILRTVGTIITGKGAV